MRQLFERGGEWSPTCTCLCKCVCVHCMRVTALWLPYKEHKPLRVHAARVCAHLHQPHDTPTTCIPLISPEKAHLQPLKMQHARLLSLYTHCSSFALMLARLILLAATLKWHPCAASCSYRPLIKPVHAFCPSLAVTATPPTTPACPSLPRRHAHTTAMAQELPCLSHGRHTL